MAETKKTDDAIVTFILDRSGSMTLGLESTMEAFNAYTQTLKDTTGTDEVVLHTLVQFDSDYNGISIDKTWHEKPIAEVPLLSRENYRPNGGTPLIDAVVETIYAIDRSLEKKPKGTKVIVCVQTDGQENSSRDHSFSQLKELVEARTAAGWQFNFMGAGINAYEQGSMMGFSAGQTMSYDRSDSEATRAAFSATAMNASAFRTGVMSSTAYSSAQKSAAGDAFDPDVKVTTTTVLSKAKTREENKSGRRVSL